MTVILACIYTSSKITALIHFLQLSVEYSLSVDFGPIIIMCACHNKVHSDCNVTPCKVGEFVPYMPNAENWIGHKDFVIHWE